MARRAGNTSGLKIINDSAGKFSKFMKNITSGNKLPLALVATAAVFVAPVLALSSTIYIASAAAIGVTAFARSTDASEIISTTLDKTKDVFDDIKQDVENVQTQGISKTVKNRLDVVSKTVESKILEILEAQREQETTPEIPNVVQEKVVTAPTPVDFNSTPIPQKVNDENQIEPTRLENKTPVAKSKSPGERAVKGKTLAERREAAKSGAKFLKESRDATNSLLISSDTNEVATTSGSQEAAPSSENIAAASLSENILTENLGLLDALQTASEAEVTTKDPVAQVTPTAETPSKEEGHAVS